MGIGVKHTVNVEDMDEWFAMDDDDETMVDLGGGMVVPLSELLYEEDERPSRRRR